MNCDEFQHLSQTWITGKIDPSEERTLQDHLDACPACRRCYHEDRAMDAMIRDAFSEESYALEPVRERIRERVRKPSWSSFAGDPASVLSLRTALVALVVLVAAGFGNYFFRIVPERQSALYRAAIADHIDDVILRVPKSNWQTRDAAMREMARTFRVDGSAFSALSLPGTRLKRMRPCNLGGERFLHVVLEGDDGEFSLFIRAHHAGFNLPGKGKPTETGGVPVHDFQSEGFHVSGFQDPRHTVMLVTEFPESEHLQITRHALQQLSAVGSHNPGSTGSTPPPPPAVG